MSETLLHFDKFIFDEMMTHPVLFMHDNPAKVAIINNNQVSLATEILKHISVKEILQINCPAVLSDSPRVKSFRGELPNLHSEKFNIIIELGNQPKALEEYYTYLDMLTLDGVLLRESGSLFDLTDVKDTFLGMYHGGFHDLQILHFPQPSAESGWRAAMLGTKSGTFQRIREKDIFNKPFNTRYYNFDVHKAALVMPEFVREELSI